MNSFVLADPDKCIGCHTCEAACVVAHSGNDLFEQEESEIAFYPRLTVIETDEVTAPVQCRHCEDAPCANVCPNGSITNKNNSIFINQDTCIGCKTCMLACPYGAISMVTAYQDGQKQRQSGLRTNAEGAWSRKERIVANKCDLCDESGNGPECVRVCPTDALRFIVPGQIDESIARKRTASAQLLQQFGSLSGY
ncbi:4Fe-4S dicluster domain-containing protein [Paenibacillus rhizophilus]|uniref:4Fe-4S dicluster domain-containing protein n=1 Tax=Paenibacillus rhizophilus TaxID=1850366 RepID=A0A3N9PCP2_9BACL|nr:4Fe-4S dicluster domain-containing protein [Paenibacillus rhizophilus]RQW13649.1 4Fe-4S dicluster domain-containing protein [Paenibacillus rhizophilus]